MNARRSPDGRVSTAASLWAPRVSLAKAGMNMASSRAADALPPAPWARVTTSSSSRGRRRRKASIRSNTASSPRPVPARRACHPSVARPAPRPAAPPDLARPPRPLAGRPSAPGPSPLGPRRCPSPLRPAPSLTGTADPAPGVLTRSTAEDQRVLGLLDAVDALGADHQAVVDGVAGRHGAAFVTGEAHGQHAPPGRLLQGPQHVGRVAARGEADRDVAGAGRGR